MFGFEKTEAYGESLGTQYWVILAIIVLIIIYYTFKEWIKDGSDIEQPSDPPEQSVQPVEQTEQEVTEEPTESSEQEQESNQTKEEYNEQSVS